MQNELCSKKSQLFWKTWKDKFKVKNKPPAVNGFTSKTVIAELFGENHKQVCTPHSAIKNDEFKTKFKECFKSLNALVVSVTLFQLNQILWITVWKS